MGISVSFPRSWCSEGVDNHDIPCRCEPEQSTLKNMEVTVSFPKSLCGGSQDISIQCDDAADVNDGNNMARLQTELSVFSEQKKKEINDLADVLLQEIKDAGSEIGCWKRGATEQSEATKKKSRHEEDLSARKDLPDDPHQKLSALRDLYAIATLSRSSLTGGAKVFYYNALKPIETCLMQHFQGDINRFLEKWDNLTGDLYRFNAQCCNGKTSCGVSMGKAQ